MASSKKWIHLSCIIVVVSLFMLSAMDTPAIIPTEIVGNLINRVGLGGWPDLMMTSTATASKKQHNKAAGKGKQQLLLPVAVNLTTCLPTFGRPGKPINCCPPGNMLDDPIVDFQFPDPATTPVRVRRFAHRLDHDSIAKYERAVSIMRSLPYSDPRSFTRQANIHCQYCTGSFLQQRSTLPVSIHSTWMFFPWHRMLLYFHEKILASLIQDDTFALPFWAWDLPEGMTLPGFYLNGSFVDTERDPTHYPPAVTDLAFQLDPLAPPPSGGVSQEDQIEVNLALMYNQMVSGAKTAELFMGCPYKTGEGGDCSGMGTIETAPHNTIHSWVGSANHPKREDMGIYYTAGRDPSFYAHHSNIDRLWEVWRATHRVEVDDPEFLDSSMYFYDEKLRLVKIRFRDVMDMEKLRYRYEDVENTWLAARPKPSVSPRLAWREIRKRGMISSQFGPTGRVLDSTVTARVVRPREVQSRTRREQQRLEEILVVEGIDVSKTDDLVKFDVYVNVVNGTIMSAKYREFVGTFVYIPRGAAEKRTTLKLGISEALEDLEADRDRAIWVTLLPWTESCKKVTVDGLSIKYARK